MSVHTTIRPVTPNDHEVSPGPVPSTAGWRHAGDEEAADAYEALAAELLQEARR